MRALLAILLFPLLVQAAGEGMWQASSVGVTLNHRGESMSSAPLSTRQPASGLMTLVAWRYQLIGPTPAGLRVRLCSQSRCVELEAEWNHHGLFRYTGGRTVALYLGSAWRWAANSAAKDSTE